MTWGWVCEIILIIELTASIILQAKESFYIINLKEKIWLTQIRIVVVIHHKVIYQICSSCLLYLLLCSLHIWSFQPIAIAILIHMQCKRIYYWFFRSCICLLASSQGKPQRNMLHDSTKIVLVTSFWMVFVVY